MSRDEEILEGLRIILKYQPNGSGYDIRAEHDAIYAGGDWDYSSDDVLKLNELDWIFSVDWDGWLYQL